MRFEKLVLTILFKNAKLNSKEKNNSEFLGRSEKGKQTSFLKGLIGNDSSKEHISPVFIKVIVPSKLKVQTLRPGGHSDMQVYTYVNKGFEIYP